MIPEWAGAYVGLPFADRGRKVERDGGLDCWGLVRKILWEQFGHCLPSWGDDYDSCTELETVRGVVKAAIPILHAQRVATPEVGDIVLLRIRGIACHVGLYIGEQRMLHIMRGRNAVVESLRRPEWARRVKGYYRV